MVASPMPQKREAMRGSLRKTVGIEAPDCTLTNCVGREKYTMLRSLSKLRIGSEVDTLIPEVPPFPSQNVATTAP